MKQTWIICMVLLLVACGGQSEMETIDKTGIGGEVVNGTVMIERQEGDFIYRLISEQESYVALADELNVWAELEYVGDEDEVEIGHAASPFWFEVAEARRDIRIGMAMDEPLIYTSIKKNEPLVRKYQKTGGWSEHTEEEEMSFNQLYMLTKGLPEGKYSFQGWAKFFVVDGKNYDFNPVELVINSEQSDETPMIGVGMDGPYALMLISDKRIYKEGEEIVIRAELQRLGGSQDTAISHGSSIVLFNVTETTRQESIGTTTTMEQKQTTLTDNEPVIVRFQKSGISNEGDEVFRQQYFNEPGFPAGFYEMTGTATFSEVEGLDYRILVTIKFEVTSK